MHQCERSSLLRACVYRARASARQEEERSSKRRSGEEEKRRGEDEERKRRGGEEEGRGRTAKAKPIKTGDAVTLNPKP